MNRARRSRPRRLVSLLAAGALLALAAQAGAAPRYYECQHPVRTGEEAYRLHDISVRAACAAVLKLGSWEYRDHHEQQLYGCRYPHGSNEAGYPYLRLHTFDGYRLSLSRVGEFMMSRGKSSFAVTGTDFPLNCT